MIPIRLNRKHGLAFLFEHDLNPENVTLFRDHCSTDGQPDDRHCDATPAAASTTSTAALAAVARPPAKNAALEGL